MSNDITVRIKADAGPLKRGMNDGERAVKDFSQSSEEMARKVAKAGAVVVTSIAAITAGVIAMAKEAAAAGVEIRNLAATAGTSTTNFQRMADASRTVGVEQEKLSDILKDVNDKFGDYMATGAGPLADFFENIAPKIGVTADQFARLSGPEALQLYVSSLERAGLSQQQMTFYMEALASDATRLLPLLRDNGREMNRLGDEAQRAGRIMDQDTIDAAVELDKAMSDMGRSLKTAVNQALLDNSEELIELAAVMTETVIPAIGRLVGAFANIVSGLASVGAAAVENGAKLIQFLNDAEVAGGSGGRRATRGGGTGETPSLTLPTFTQNQGGGRGGVVSGGPGMTTGGALDPTGGLLPALMNEGTPLDPTGGLTAPLLQTSATGFTGEDGLLPEFSAADRARMALEELEEVQEEARTSAADHEAELTRIEEQAARDRERIAMQEAFAKKQAMATLFSDLTSLMGSENDKLFKIGKAAAIAEATISGFYSAQKAYEGGLRVSGGIPAVGAAFAAASIAKTAMVISQLKSTQPNGGGSTASAGGAGSAASSAGGADAGGGASPTTTFSFVLQNDPMGFGESFARQMIEQLNEAQRNGSNIRGVLA